MVKIIYILSSAPALCSLVISIAQKTTELNFIFAVILKVVWRGYFILPLAQPSTAQHSPSAHLINYSDP